MLSSIFNKHAWWYNDLFHGCMHTSPVYQLDYLVLSPNCRSFSVTGQASFHSPEWTAPRFEALATLYPHKVFREMLSIRALELDASRFRFPRTAALPLLARTAVFWAINEDALAFPVDELSRFGIFPCAFACLPCL